MLTTIGTTFPANWQYGPEEIEIFSSTAGQINDKFSNQNNLLINTTWFGSQFDNGEWNKVLELSGAYDNLFLLSVIDPLYLQDNELEYIQNKFNIKNTYRIGMFADSEYEWNFHSFVVADHCPVYTAESLMPTRFEFAYMLYQRKPRAHRIELTNILTAKGLLGRGIVTLGEKDKNGYDWGLGQTGPVLTINDSPLDYKHNGSLDDFGGIPNDLVSIGQLDHWRKCFLNIISETEFDEWRPRFVTEKTWKPIIGLRPYLVHGQREVYNYLKKNGFKIFNQYWNHIDVEGSPDQHGNVVKVIEFLAAKSAQELNDIYNDMLPDLLYNKQRYYEFATEQKHFMNHLFKN